ncbi:phenylalanine--tRNA ligase subunit beta [[Mycoplasma] falconis]|uniref:Phenylalanine--tRNA ligase beta subunit n=1 Tax=[Mycoplasma] falconis TaxID=92403 RepID=A0A501X930_9BACT|nr:phenylalanine--tRNA ligase subunit beta [[Mycoplasma] falconis]TPE57078.1 phenylalanine--tRNA ligase subunit beta [[Mycoplasma] falconis]
MIFSYKQLCRLAHINVPVEEVVKAINSIGFEVEEYKKFSDVEGIKFCHVLKAYKNPNADRLTVCEIEFGNGEKSVIQTTATNMADDQYVMAFVPGARSGKMVFAPRTMQGIVSNGMFVGLGELGFNVDVLPEEDKDGIFQVGPIDLNLDPIDYFDLDDYLIDVSILSNRADANCYLIFARELAAYFNSYVDELSKAKPNLLSDIKITSLKETNAFTLIETKNDNLGLSKKEQMLLWKHDIKTFNNAVDLTNWVLLFAGVPCHVYDKDEMKSNEFSTDLSSDKVNILGNKEVQLDNNLVVKNGEDIVSVAATIGLENKQFNSKSLTAIFELASFNLKEVRRSAKQVKLNTNSSNRASKEISNGELLMAYDFLASYLNNYSEQINAPKQAKKSILIDYKYLVKYAGFSINKTKRFNEVIKKLEILGFKFKKDLSSVSFPTYRYDLKNMQDFVEEVFRFYGYDKFPSKAPKITRLINTENIEPKFNLIMSNKGYFNVRTYTLIKPEDNIFNPFNLQEKLNANDSKNYDHSQIRHSLISSLANVLIHNQKQGMTNGSYFEIGMINDQMNVLGLTSTIKSFEQIKANLVSLTNKQLEFKKSETAEFHPNVSTDIYIDGEKVGYIAKINPKILNIDAIFAEILLDKLTNKPVQYKDYKHAPLKSRDVTFTLSKFESIDDKIQAINKLKGIYQVNVIDVYQKDEDTKNVTVSVILEEWATKKFDQDFNK